LLPGPHGRLRPPEDVKNGLKRAQKKKKDASRSRRVRAPENNSCVILPEAKEPCG